MPRLTFILRKLLTPVLLLVLVSMTLIFNYNFIIRNIYYKKTPASSNYEYPGSYLTYRRSFNESFCNFQFGLPDILLYEDTDLRYPPEMGAQSPYRVLYNVIKGDPKGAPAVTYATHVTADFANYIAEVARSWDGPISVAAFAPKTDANVILQQVYKVCTCVPAMQRLSLHLVFPQDEPPLVFNPLENPNNTCTIQDSSRFSTYRKEKKMFYPINVCRNVARQASHTNYIMVTDIQFVASQNLASNFLKMVATKLHKSNPSHIVFVVPVFEVDEYSEIPRRKKELIELLKEEKACYFHRHTCVYCQKFPRIDRWMKTDPGAELRPFALVKREYPFHRWEPIYIGTKNEPLYSEGLSWEGLQDKMTQMLEMCLIGYRFVIIDGGFLVHWPGMKKTGYRSWRNTFISENNRQYKKIIKIFLQNYRNNLKCKVKSG